MADGADIVIVVLAHLRAVYVDLMAAGAADDQGIVFLVFVALTIDRKALKVIK